MSLSARAFAGEWTTEACARRLAAVYRMVRERHSAHA